MVKLKLIPLLLLISLPVWSHDNLRSISALEDTITRDLNIDIHRKTFEEPFNWERVTQLYNETKLLRPNDSTRIHVTHTV